MKISENVREEFFDLIIDLIYTKRLWTSMFVIYFFIFPMEKIELNGFNFSLTRKKPMTFPDWLEFPDNFRFSRFPGLVATLHMHVLCIFE